MRLTLLFRGCLPAQLSTDSFISFIYSSYICIPIYLSIVSFITYLWFYVWKYRSFFLFHCLYLPALISHAFTHSFTPLLFLYLCVCLLIYLSFPAICLRPDTHACQPLPPGHTNLADDLISTQQGLFWRVYLVHVYFFSLSWFPFICLFFCDKLRWPSG